MRMVPAPAEPAEAIEKSIEPSNGPFIPSSFSTQSYSNSYSNTHSIILPVVSQHYVDVYLALSSRLMWND